MTQTWVRTITEVLHLEDDRWLVRAGEPTADPIVGYQIAILPPGEYQPRVGDTLGVTFNRRPDTYFQINSGPWIRGEVWITESGTCIGTPLVEYIDWGHRR